MSLDQTGGVGYLLNVAVKNAVRYVLYLNTSCTSQEGSLSGFGEFAQYQLFVIDMKCFLSVSVGGSFLYIFYRFNKGLK